MERHRDFDIVVHGASGFTGRLVAGRLAARAAAEGVRWAVSGRDARKLAATLVEIGAPADTPVIVADAADPASLDALAKRTRVVLTTVGPYQLYGSGRVAACAAAGADYADLCGEPVWMRDMIDRHHAAAERSGARIIPLCGFDSIPSELSARVYVRHPEHLVLVQAELARGLGGRAQRVYLQADVCRADLLVEVEAQACHQLS